MGRDRNRDTGGRPVEPTEARTHGNDPDAVRIDREGDARDTGRTDAGLRRISDDRHRDYYDGLEGVTRRDSVRWGPVWAGLITALTTYLLLQLLAIGGGLQDVGPGSQGGGGWVPVIIGLIAFFIGGLVAGITSAVRGGDTGLLHGFLVWALGTVLILLLSALGLGQLFGALGNVAGQVGPGTLSNAANSAQSNAPNVDPQQVAQAIRDGALGAFFGLLFSALAAALGGFLGGKSPDPIGHMTDARSE